MRKSERECSVDGCEKIVFRATMCGMHRSRIYRTGHTNKTRSYLGVFKDPSWARYKGMITRCYNPKDVSYKNYGGRGITVCDRWSGEDGFENYKKDIGNQPDPKLTVDRINNDGNYEPDNCRWATRKEQVMNRRKPKKRPISN